MTTGSAGRPAAESRSIMNRLLAVVGGLPLRVGVLVVFALAVPQIYPLPSGTIDIPLSTIAAVLLAPTVAIRTWGNPGVRRLLRTALMYSVFGLLAIRFLAIFWSPEVGSGRLPMVLLAQFIITLVLVYGAAGEEPGLLWQVQFAYWPLVMLEALLVVLFRVFPGVEDGYLHSIAGVFAGQNTVEGLFDVNRNNVLDPTKSGGVFVNANVAGLFLGVSAMAAFAVWSITRRRFLLVAGFVALTGIWFTGSKSGRMFSIVLPLAALAAYFWPKLRPALRRYLLIGAGAASVAAVVLLAVSGGAFAAAVRVAVGERTEIWGFAAEAFADHPVLGLGWGGWQEGFASYAAENGIYNPNFPPHNILLAAWASTGLIGLALTVLIFWLLLRLVVKSFGRDPLFVAWAGAAFVWVMVQAMGENTDVFGEIHLIPALALLLCFLFHPLRQEPGRVKDADIWSRETSIVPAVRDVHPEPGAGDEHVPPPVHRTGRGHQGPGQPRHP